MKILEKCRLKEIVNKIVENCNLTLLTYEDQENIKQIENYFGLLIPLNIVGLDNSDKEKEVNVMLKLKPNKMDDRMKAVLDYLFETEHYLYSRLVPMFRQYNISIDEIIPTCYYADLQLENEVIVLQDMTYKGYRRFSGDGFFDYDHVLVSLKTLAKFHSLSYILLKNGKKPDDDIILKPYTNTYPAELNLALKLSLDNHIKYFNGNKYEFIKSLRKRYDLIRGDVVKGTKCLVYAHGDFWKENILLKYEAGKPIHACIVDFQTVQYMSASQDFLNFLISCTDTETRKEYFEEFLTIYLATVTTTLRENDVELSSLKENFKHDLRLVAENCIIRSFMAFALWCGLEEGGETLLTSKNTINKSQAISRFTKIIGDVLDDLNQVGLISL
ncbi:uncharacterized protein LOC123709974 isoform X1 [Pieris brassicae]|uniref:uncharacterized protein LOC123709974 isoform X1 n=1 Tax=Pieris brassicae TaxID=7116 RepID=UPI001E6624C5|nr:uncharacterized protein LOC123709974 isoform X1 [Pieris brassicae]